MPHFILHLPARLPWPLPALSAWAVAWASWQLAIHSGVPAGAALGCGIAGGAALAWTCQGTWRRAISALGFPLLALASGAAQGLPAWTWLLLTTPLLLLYPLGAWRDAPFFPTPRDGLNGLAAALGDPQPKRVLDAGCGLGHGLAALRTQWPAAQLIGIERSRVLQLAAALRCRFATVRSGDIWAADWRSFDLVYLFQRPESMPRAWAKAVRDMRPGSWLVSLEFEVPGVTPHAVLDEHGISLRAVLDEHGISLNAVLDEHGHSLNAVLDAAGRQRRPVWAYRLPDSIDRRAGR